MKRRKAVALAGQWLKSCRESVGKWWGIMSGALSIPFAFLALFNLFSARLLFAALAYIALWGVVVAQRKQISDLNKAKAAPNVTLRVGPDLIDIDNEGRRWIRGELENRSEHRAEACRVKLLRVEGQNAQAHRVENGILEWQGGGCEPRSLDPHEKLIFDIGIRIFFEPSPLLLFSFFGASRAARGLASPGRYMLTLGVYGRNIPTTEKSVPIVIGQAADDTQFPA